MGQIDASATAATCAAQTCITNAIRFQGRRPDPSRLGLLTPDAGTVTVLSERPTGTRRTSLGSGSSSRTRRSARGFPSPGTSVTARDASTTGPLQFDTTKANHARMHDY